MGKDIQAGGAQVAAAKLQIKNVELRRSRLVARRKEATGQLYEAEELENNSEFLLLEKVNLQLKRVMDSDLCMRKSGPENYFQEER